MYLVKKIDKHTLLITITEPKVGLICIVVFIDVSSSIC